MIHEGQSSSTAILNRPDGVLIQELPFTINLKKFTIDFYSTGMPKLFASDVEVRDNQTGEIAKATIEVNKPLIFKGVAIYQSSFEDGGSKLKLTGYPMAGTDTSVSRSPAKWAADAARCEPTRSNGRASVRSTWKTSARPTIARRKQGQEPAG
jgi:cytochrome c biogenesis protein ResB